jgi:L-aminopeptidase/D-esterase-like protein
MGYAACEAASSDPPAMGSVGAGAGATVGKVLGIANATRGGVGAAAYALGAGVIVGALVAVNAFGDVVDPQSGRILAGARRGDTFAGTQDVLLSRVGQTASPPSSSWGRDVPPPGPAPVPPTEPAEPVAGEHTVIGVVATNAALSKAQVTKVAQMAHDGLARAVRPAHTLVDGDTLFALALGAYAGDVNTIGAFAADAVAEAIRRAVLHATAAGGVPAARDIA